MVAPFTNPNPGVKVEIDGFSYYVHFVGLTLPRFMYQGE